MTVNLPENGHARTPTPVDDAVNSMGSAAREPLTIATRKGYYGQVELVGYFEDGRLVSVHAGLKRTIKVNKQTGEMS